MMLYSNPVLEFEQSQIFSIADDELTSVIEELDQELVDELRENDRRETISNEYASRFVTTIQ